MVYLLLAMLSSTLISVLMRLGSQQVRSKLGLLSVNYLVCTALAATYVLEDGFLPASAALPRTIWLGVLCGVFYLLAFVLFQWNTIKNGVVLSSVFMKLGVLVPTLMSILFFDDQPTLPQGAGLALAVAAILIMNLQPGEKQARAGSAVGLILLLFFGGMADGMAKIYEQYGTPALQPQYLLYTFIVAAALCILVMVRQKQRIGGAEFVYGALLGIPNFFSAKFLLGALDSMKAVVVYPTFSVGTIVLISLCGLLLFREKLTRRQLVGVGIILVALVLLNVK